MVDLIGYKNDEVIITKTLGIVDGQRTWLFSADGCRDGVAVAAADIESGAITEQSAIDELSQMWLDQKYKVFPV